MLRHMDNLLYKWLCDCLVGLRISISHDESLGSFFARHVTLHLQLSNIAPLFDWRLWSLLGGRSMNQRAVLVCHHTVQTYPAILYYIEVWQISQLVESECLTFAHDLMYIFISSLPFLLALVQLTKDLLSVFLSLLDPFSLQGLLLFPQLAEYVRVWSGISNYAGAAHCAMESSWNGMASSRWIWVIASATSCRVQTAAWSLPPYPALLIRSTSLLTWHVITAAAFPVVLAGQHVWLLGFVFSWQLLSHALLEQIFGWPDIVLLVEVLSLVILRIRSPTFLLLFFVHVLRLFVLHCFRAFTIMWGASFTILLNILSRSTIFTDTWVYFHVIIWTKKINILTLLYFII